VKVRQERAVLQDARQLVRLVDDQGVVLWSSPLVWERKSINKARLETIHDKLTRASKEVTLDCVNKALLILVGRHDGDLLAGIKTLLGFEL
jgi:hypothetical protein